MGRQTPRLAIPAMSRIRAVKTSQGLDGRLLVHAGAKPCENSRVPCDQMHGLWYSTAPRSDSDSDNAAIAHLLAYRH